MFKRGRKRAAAARLIEKKLIRLGMQAKTDDIASVLAARAVEDSAAQVERVKIELSKVHSGIRQATRRPITKGAAKRPRPPKIPQKRPRKT